MKGEHRLTRRSFVQGLCAVSLTASGLPGLHAAPYESKAAGAAELSGREFWLEIAETPLNFSGTPAVATTINGRIPGPVLHWKEGEEVTLHVTNRLKVDTSIHWHGIVLPTEMDGVPGLSYGGIKPGETFTYRFTVRQSGTFWYHSHSGFQEQTGLYGAIVIDPAEPDPFEFERDYVVQLSDWSDEKPSRIYRKLKVMSGYYNFTRRTVGDFFAEVREKGLFGAFAERKMWNEMSMSDRDLSDVTGYTYTYLMNGHTPENHWKGLFKAGERVRLRFINSSAMTFFDVRIPGLKMRVVAADGNNVQPVEVDEFRIGVAETYDVIVEPEAGRAYALFAQSLDRSGCAAGTLTDDAAITAELPPMDPLPILTHRDMGMGGMHAMEDKGGGGMTCGSGMMHEMKTMKRASPEDAIPVTPLKTRWGVQTTMRAENPQYRLDDPGAGLRNNGRRVLTYADLKSLRSTAGDPWPDRQIILHLTGNMERYMWSINGIRYADAAPLEFRYGERIRVTFINDTMMSHPMHLHGMWSDLETGDGEHLPRKHTVIVQPGSKISYRVTIDAKGKWAYHCHLLYHMAGMFRKVVVT
jgi:CopA family copper-resistance protein